MYQLKEIICIKNDPKESIHMKIYLFIELRVEAKKKKLDRNQSIGGNSQQISLIQGFNLSKTMFIKN